MAALDESLALEALGHGQWRGRADPRYEANTGMFGGWTMAVLLKAVLDDPSAEGAAVAVTANFVNRITPGAELTLRTERLGGGRSIAHWRSEVSVDGQLAASALVVLANRRESDRYTEQKMPEAPAPESLPALNPPGPFGAQTEMRMFMGFPPFAQPTTRSLFWGKEVSGRRMDAVQLAYLCDLGPPRVLYIGSAPRPSSTTTMSLYVHATAAELAACGDDYILSDMIGTRIEHSTVGSRTDLWSRSGALLATSEQLCWFK